MFGTVPEALVLDASPGGRRVCQGDLSQALDYRHGAAKLTANPITKSTAVSSRYTIVIHRMEAALRFPIKDKVSYRSLVVATKARTEPNQPAAGCR